eukprot:1300591-Karenia_brevis.AAC.1
MNETRDTGLRTLCASGKSAGPRTLHSPVEEDDDQCPDLILSISESDAEAEDKYNGFDTDETDEQESNI